MKITKAILKISVLRKLTISFILSFLSFFLLSNIVFNINSESVNINKINDQTYNLVFLNEWQSKLLSFQSNSFDNELNKIFLNFDNSSYEIYPQNQIEFIDFNLSSKVIYIKKRNNAEDINFKKLISKKYYVQSQMFLKKEIINFVVFVLFFIMFFFKKLFFGFRDYVVFFYLDIVGGIKDNASFNFLLLYFIIIFCLTISYLFPGLEEIIAYDETVYLNSGRDLVDNLEVWPYGRGPLIAIYYGIIYLFSKLTNFIWIEFVTIFSRILNLSLIILFSFALFSKILRVLNITAENLKYILIISIPFLPLYNLVNPSYSLFTLTATLTLYWGIDLFFSRFENKKVIFTFSILLGLLGLIRPDVIVLFPLYAIFYLILFFYKQSKNYLNVLIFLFPFIFLVYGYIYFQKVTTGVVNTGSMQKMYLAFEGAESLMLENYGNDPFIVWIEKARDRAELMYGSREDNNWNVFVAISNNPKAYFLRQIETFKMTYKSLGEAFANYDYTKLNVLIYLFLLGLAYLFSKNFIFGFFLISWLSHLGLYFFTAIYSSYLSLNYYIFSFITFFGIYFLMSQNNNLKRIIFLLPITLYSFYNSELFTIGLVMLFLFFGSNFVNLRIFKFKNYYFSIPNILLILILTFNFWDYRKNLHEKNTVYSSEIRSAINYLSLESNQASSKVLSFSHLIPSGAKYKYVIMDKNQQVEFKEFKKYLRDQNINYIVFDKDYNEINPYNFKEYFKNFNEKENIFIEKFNSNFGNISILKIRNEI